jgi:hypothetical protein
MAVDTMQAPPDVAREVALGRGLSLPQAARRFPSYRQAKPTSPATVWRWITSGVELADGTRVRLEAVRLSGRWLTSEDAISRFVRSQTPGLDDPPAAPRPPAERRRRSEAAERELKMRGC